MRRYKSRGMVDTAAAPAWWLSSPDQLRRYLESLRGVKLFEIGRSAGGRSILAAAWGQQEALGERTSTSLGSAISGGSADAFYGEPARKRQVFVFVGAAHGTEIEGTVAALNALNVIVCGKDLRGRPWERLAEEGRKLRIVVIPFLNIDGRSRYKHRLHFVGVDWEDYRRMSQGDLKDGTKLDWPESKLYYPLPAERVSKPMGTYFNDNGCNLVYDVGLADDCQPETRALLGLLRREMPDCVLLSHSNQGTLVMPPSSFIPQRFRDRVLQMGAIVGSRCRHEGLKRFTISDRSESYAGQVYYQSDLVYHCCGALPLLVEFPWGYRNVPDNHDEILDTGLFALEEIIAFGASYRFRPPEPKWK